MIIIYKKDIKETTREYLIRKYENYRKSVAFIDIVKILNVQVCPYCNRNFSESYTIVDEYGKKKRNRNNRSRNRSGCSKPMICNGSGSYR